jgi:hypothetical protein
MRRRKLIARVRLRERHPAEIPVTEVLAIYLADLSQRHQRRLQVNRHVAALHVWWADKTLAEINGPNCQAYVKQRTKQRRRKRPKTPVPEQHDRPSRLMSAAEARRELEELRAAINHHHRKGLCSERVAVVLPSPTVPRGGAHGAEAALLWAAWKARQTVRDNAIVRGLYRPNQDATTRRDGVPTTPTPIASRSHDQLEAFCALALGDASLQAKLGAPHGRDHFISLVVRLARHRGLDVDAKTVRAAMVHGIEHPIKGRVGEPPWQLSGWLPVRAVWLSGQLYVRWSYLGQVRLREPFFEGSVQHCFLKPFNRLFAPLTPIANLAEMLSVRPSLPPRGFIFHMSRCGSTLVSQMLAASNRNIVVSEASPIDAVVRAKDVRPDLPDDEQAQWLTAIIAALGQPRRGEQNFFLKMENLHTLALPLFRRAFPSVPWIFLYRDPVEVVVSQFHSPGPQMMPRAVDGRANRLAGAFGAKITVDSMARVLATACGPVAGHYRDGGGLLVNYCELPDAVWGRILPHFGVACSRSDRVAMAAAARYDAKTPTFVFAPDGAAKQHAATTATRAAADKHLRPIYRRLEALRRSNLRWP